MALAENGNILGTSTVWPVTSTMFVQFGSNCPLFSLPERSQSSHDAVNILRSSCV